MKFGYPHWNHLENTTKKILENDMKHSELYDQPTMTPMMPMTPRNKGKKHVVEGEIRVVHT